jgi:hypothetical protein
MEFAVKFSERLWARLVHSLWSRDDVETAAAVIVKPVAANEATALVVQDVHPVDESAYLVRRPDFIELSPTWINERCRDARARGLGVLMVHTHLHGGRPDFSWADDKGDARLMPAMSARVAPAPVGSIVVSRDDARARVLANDRLVPARLTVAGSRLQTFPTPNAPGTEAHARQALALGAHGQAALADLRVGIVGLGGTGSVVHLLLRHLGVKSVLTVEHDVLENTNKSRVVGSRSRDPEVATTKTAIALRLARDIQGDDARLSAVEAALIDEPGAHALAACDIVFSCVDRLLPRALLNSLAYEAAVLVVDMGSAFRVDDSGRLVSQGGKVAIVGPGRPCLWCWGDLDSARLRAESLAPADRESLAAEGYVEGAATPQPAVITFNTQIAAVAVTEALRLVTAFAGSEDPPNRFNFDFVRGTTTRARAQRRLTCPFCGE